jgi:hypothetical protein
VAVCSRGHRRLYADIDRAEHTSADDR